MWNFYILLLLIATNLSLNSAANQTTVNTTKIENPAKIVAPGVTLAQTLPDAVKKSSEQADEKPKTKENAQPPTSIKENKAVPINAHAVKPTETKTNSTVVVNQEKPQKEKQANSTKEQPPKKETEKSAQIEPTTPFQIDINQYQFQQEQLNSIDVDIEDSVRTAFYILMGLSVGALLFVGFKINKLRLSRAERKYGVQGNRANQELAPLPLSMEAPDSDDEDQTLFDIKRHQSRIF